MKNFKLLLVAQSLFCSTILYSQDLPSFTPASPTASELGKYGQVPVGMFTGTLQYSIPLFEINQSNFKLPISLSYSSNGINVDKYATTVGMEWTLNAGGVITRALMDEADEYYRQELPNYVMGSSEMNSFLNGVMTSNYDTQPDIYSFNVGGFSGKFYFDEFWNIIQIEPTSVIIEKIINTNGNDDELDFKLITPDGVQFFFGGVNATEHSFSRSDDLGAGGMSAPSDITDVAWYLSKIKLLNGDEILFNYINSNFNYNSGISQILTASYIHEDGYAPVFISAQQNEPIINKSYSSISNISSIIWTGGRLDFNYSGRNTGNTLLKLDSIKLSDFNNSIIKGYNLKYTVVDSDYSYSNPGSETNSKRLFLEEVLPTNSSDIEGEGYFFEYYSFNELPPRLTYSRDYWGYFNGSNNSYLVSNDLSGYNQSDYFEPPFTIEEIKYLYRNIDANRKADGVFGVKGLLKKIKYPTKGTNTFVYESHSYYGDVKVYGSPTTKSTSIQTDEEEYGTHKSSVIVTNAVAENITLYPYVSSVLNCGSHGGPGQVKATFYVYDITDSNNIFPIPFYFNPAYGGSSNTYGTSFTIEESTYNQNYPPTVSLQEGHDYKFEVVIIRPCIDAGFSFSHSPSSQIIQDNIVVGGMRIKQVLSEDNNGNIYSEDYSYGDLNCLTCSTGVREQIKPSISFNKNSTYENGVNGSSTTIKNGIAISSSSLNSLYFSQSYHIGYPIVTKYFNNNLEKGIIKYQHNIAFDATPIIIGSFLAGTPNTNSFGTGDLLSETHYRQTSSGINGLVKVLEKTNNYITDPNLQNQIQGYSVGYNGIYGFTIVGYLTGAANSSVTTYDVNKYFIRSRWRYLNQTIEKQYDDVGLNQIETTINYFYDNPEHLQVTRTETTSSEGNIIISKTYYPDDVLNSNSLENNTLNANELAAIELLKSPSLSNPNGQHRIIEPVQQEAIVKDSNGAILSKTVNRTNYYNWQNNLVLPKTIQTLNGDYSSSNELEDRITYHRYNSTGHPLEVSKTNGVKIVYVWGYNEQYPVAKIENATYSEVESVLGVNFNLGNSGLTPTQESSLRSNPVLSKAMVSTYTYDPLIGVTSMTDAKGYTIYYEYDEFNRLKHVKDKDGNILSENQYNYKQ